MEKLLKLIKDLTWFNKVEKSKEIYRLLVSIFLQDAPKDGNQYARQDGEWTEVENSGGGDFTLTEENVGEFMDVDLVTKLTPSTTDTLLSRDLLTNNAVEVSIGSILKLANSYSTTETLTGGTWIDGKPIYSKTQQILFTNIPTGTNQVGEFGELNANFLDLIDSRIILKTNLGYYHDLQSYCNRQTNLKYAVEGATGLGTFLIFINGGTAITNNFTCICTIQYTKTTD